MHTARLPLQHKVPGQPNQLEAQEVSLGRALESAGFSKSYRREFITAWKQDYLKRHPAHKPEQPKCEIPDSWYKLDKSDITKKGDVLYFDDGEVVEIFDGNIGRKVYTFCIRGFIARRLPKGAKLIHGKWMRKLAPDEYPQKGDWWGNDENDPWGCYFYTIADNHPTSWFNEFHTFYRRIQTKGNK